MLSYRVFAVCGQCKLMETAMFRQIVSAAALVGLVACAPEASAPAETQGPAIPDLAELFDCVRQNDGVLIAAHRGGPAPGYPENAIETMQYNFINGVRIFEIDIAETRDGVLVLMHDDRLNRTSTGRGYVSDMDWEEMSGLDLVDNSGKRTAYGVPKLSDALLWAKETGAILELDRKKTTSFRNIATSVGAADARDNVIFISYTDAEAGEIAAIDPSLMMTASAFGGRDIDALAARGVDPEHLIAWTGTKEPDAAAFARLRREGVEPAFGTLGRRGESLDDVYMADGNGEEYQALADSGIVMLATDRPFDAAKFMTADDTAISACGL